jgi:hypothetical protein
MDETKYNLFFQIVRYAISMPIDEVTKYRRD